MCDIDIKMWPIWICWNPSTTHNCILWVPNLKCFYLICNFCNFFSYARQLIPQSSISGPSDVHVFMCFSEFIFATRDAKLKIMAMPPEIPDEQHILPHLHLKVQCSSKQIINLEPRTFFQLVPSVMSCFK